MPFTASPTVPTCTTARPYIATGVWSITSFGTTVTTAFVGSIVEHHCAIDVDGDGDGDGDVDDEDVDDDGSDISYIPSKSWWPLVGFDARERASSLARSICVLQCIAKQVPAQCILFRHCPHPALPGASASCSASLGRFRRSASSSGIASTQHCSEHLRPAVHR
jgi:hypothetical protein